MDDVLRVTDKKIVILQAVEIMTSTWDIKKNEQTELRSYTNTTKMYVQLHISNLLFHANREQYE